MAKKKFPKVLKKTLTGLLAGVSTGLLIFLFSQSEVFISKYFEQFERLFYDLTFKFNYVYTLDNLMNTEEKSVQADSTIEQRIQVIDIDERALSKLGSYNTWPRTHHAAVVDYLAKAGASSITFDILFKNADFGERDAKNALKVLEKVRPDQDWTNYYGLRSPLPQPNWPALSSSSSGVMSVLKLWPKKSNAISAMNCMSICSERA